MSVIATIGVYGFTAERFLEALRTADVTVVLDVREPEEYAHGHVPGAINVPQADLASRLGEVPRDRPVLVVCQSGSRSRRAAQFLLQMGFERVASVRGGTAAWCEAGKATSARKRRVQTVIPKPCRGA